MKFNLKHIFIASIVLATSLSSCSDILNETPESELDSGRIFSTLSGARVALNGVYEALSREEHYGMTEIPMSTSDDMNYVSGNNIDAGHRDISHYAMQPSNTWLKQVWEFKYLGINRASHVIYNIKNMAEYKSGNAEALAIEGEARFLRAMLAFGLVRYWGDVPFKTELTDSYESAFLPRSKASDIYDHIIADLNIAKTQLPWAGASVSNERATQGAARALLMRVYMQRAGYTLDSETGEQVIPDEATRQKYFEEAIKEYAEFKANGYHGLVQKVDGGYTKLWKNFSENVVDSKESIFEIAFYTVSGNRVGASRYGTYIGPKNSDDYATGGFGNAIGNILVLPEWYTYYEDADERKNVNTAIVGTTNYPGKWRREWIGRNRYRDRNNTDVNFVFLRYADVLLLAAEAYNETKNTTEAINLINEVRSRSGATPLNVTLTNYAALYAKKTGTRLSENMDMSAIIPDGNNQGKVRVALFYERGFEMCFEQVRKYDLIRWGILHESIQKHSDSKSKSGYKALENFKKNKHELFPIPLAEMEQNFELKGKNNPGY